MKLNDAEVTKWVIELRDGALEIQRVFEFVQEAHRQAFVSYVGHFMKSPSISVAMEQGPRTSKSSVMVRIRILPEQSLLRAAGEIAETCEHGYSRTLDQGCQSAA